jgi:hypothetical protein
MISIVYRPSVKKTVFTGVPIGPVVHKCFSRPLAHEKTNYIDESTNYRKDGETK